MSEATTQPPAVLHVAIVHDRLDPTRGGAERYLAELAGRLVAAGHAVTVYGRTFGALPAGVRARTIAAPGFTRVARERRFAAAAVAAARADGAAPLLAARHIVEADVYQPHGGTWAAAAAARREATVVPLFAPIKAAWQRWAPRHRHFRRVEQTLLARADVQVVAVSERVRADLLAIEPAAGARIVVLPPALAVERFLSLRADRAARVAAAARDAIPRLLFCGHDFALKGLSHALAAFRRSGAFARGARLTVVGRGDRRRWQREAAALGIAAAVEWAGAVPDVGAALAAADLLLHPTWFDPCALVCLEALAAGVPVVTTQRNGAAPWVLRGGGCVVLRPDDHAELAAAVDALLVERPPPLAVAEITDAFGWDAHLRRLVPLLAAAAAERRR